MINTLCNTLRNIKNLTSEWEYGLRLPVAALLGTACGTVTLNNENL